MTRRCPGQKLRGPLLDLRVLCSYDLVAKGILAASFLDCRKNS